MGHDHPGVQSSGDRTADSGPMSAARLVRLEPTGKPSWDSIATRRACDFQDEPEMAAFGSFGVGLREAHICEEFVFTKKHQEVTRILLRASVRRREAPRLRPTHCAQPVRPRGMQ